MNLLAYQIEKVSIKNSTKFQVKDKEKYLICKI